MKKGFSLIETLVVVGLFAFIGIIVSQSTATTLTGSRKAESSTKVRENLNQAINVMERQLRSAKSITSCTANNINYVDEDGANSNIFCQNVSTTCAPATQSYVYLNSSTFRLTNPDTICITACQFSCVQTTPNVPPSVEISLEGKSKTETGVEDTTIRVETNINLRAY